LSYHRVYDYSAHRVKFPVVRKGLYYIIVRSYILKTRAINDYGVVGMAVTVTPDGNWNMESAIAAKL
jgi:hypothetical protein